MVKSVKYMVKILDGIKVRNFIADKVKSELGKIKIKPKLVIFQIGEDPRSTVYIRQKKIFGEKLGFEVEHIELDTNIKETELISRINIFNSNPMVNGIIVQFPLPKHIDSGKIFENISPEKDVDGLNSKNLKLLFEGSGKKDFGFIPATTKGIISLLDFYQIKIEGKKVTIIGRSLLVGRPTAMAFLNRNATVTICHSKTKKLKDEMKSSDIIVSAIGKPNFLKKNFVKKDQIIIDVGISKTKNGVVGDVDFKNVSKIVKAIAPVPGGVGPMTVISLFENLLLAYNRQKRNVLE